MVSKKQPDKQVNYRNKGQFQPGQSGNPSGRPRSESTIIKQKLAENSEVIFSAWMNKIKEGDGAAIKLAVDRLVPAIKPVAAPVAIAVNGESLVDKAKDVFASAASGEISSDVASQLISSVAALARIQEVTELEQRIKALEERNEP